MGGIQCRGTHGDLLVELLAGPLEIQCALLRPPLKLSASLFHSFLRKAPLRNVPNYGRKVPGIAKLDRTRRELHGEGLSLLAQP